MRYYVLADVHGFYSETLDALRNQGYYEDKGEKKIIILGDILDRGREPIEMIDFVLDLIKNDEVILVKGNHEELFLDLVNRLDYYLDRGIINTHHFRNRTFQTLMDLTGMDFDALFKYRSECVKIALDHPFVKRIIPKMVNFFETDNYIFVHGWIPCNKDYLYTVVPNWRDDESDWYHARWINGMEAWYNGAVVYNKTIVCGHYHASFGHHYYEGDGPEFGEGANFNPFYGKGIIAIDACTAVSGKVNCIVLED